MPVKSALPPKTDTSFGISNHDNNQKIDKNKNLIS